MTYDQWETESGYAERDPEPVSFRKPASPAPAFPQNEWSFADPLREGMSLRDWFAGQAIQTAFMIRQKGLRDADFDRLFGSRVNIADSEIVAALAYGLADAMLAARAA
jgi:hypothetical protein